MTDLEDLWSEYPTSPPPVDALLRRARAQARVRRQRLLVRPLLAGGVAACVAGAFVVGTNLDGRVAPGSGVGGDAAGSADPALRNSAFQADLRPAASCGQLLASYRKRGRAQVGPWGWTTPGVLLGDVSAEKAPAALAASAGAADDSAVGNSATGTNVQEAGVDEPDDVKTNGTLLVRAHGARVSVYDVSRPAVRRTATLTLPRLSDGQLLLRGTTLVALGTDTADAHAMAPGTRVETVSLADPAHPRVTAQVRYSGSLASARQHGSVVRLVLADGLPTLPFVQPHGTLTQQQALRDNRRIVQRSTLDDWLPRYDDGSGSRPLLACDRVALPSNEVTPGIPLGTESVAGFDVSAPTRPNAIGLAGQTDDAYESADHLYLTSSPHAVFSPGGGGGCLRCVAPLASGAGTASGAPAAPAPPPERTSIFQFDLSGTGATHVATGRVDGTIANRWSMDEAGGVLRVALTHGVGTKRASAVVTLRPSGATLVEIGRLDGLGANETLTAARWFDDLAILSTARQTDPLFTVDLTDPTHPVLQGALHIPGYSTYFHPIGDHQLLGIGQAVSFQGADRRERERAQVGLFDIGDLTKVRRQAVVSLHQWTWPSAGDDPRTFTWLPDRRTALTSFTTMRGHVLLGEYRVTGSTMSQTLTSLSVRPGHPVRTMELPSGKVVLIAGGHVSFLSL